MEHKEIKVTIEIGDNLRMVLEKMVKELSRYMDAKDTNEGLRIMGEIIEKFLKKGTEEIQITGYYDRDMVNFK